MSYDVVFVASCQINEAQLAAWKKTKVDPKRWSDWKGSFGNGCDDSPTVATLLKRWKAWGTDGEPEFLTCTLSKGKLTLQGVLAETTYHEAAPLLGGFFRSCEGFAGTGAFYALADGFTYEISVADGASRCKAVPSAPAAVKKSALVVEKEAARRVGESDNEPSAAPPKEKKASLSADPPPPPSLLVSELDALVYASKYKPVEAYAKRYFAAGLPGLEPNGAQSLLECWFRQQKVTGVEPLLAAVLAKTEAAMDAKKPKDKWLADYQMNVSLLWVLGFAKQADRGIAWFQRLRALGGFVNVNAFDAYVYLLYTSTSAAREVREHAITDMRVMIKKDPYEGRMIKWAWHNLAALAAVLGDAVQVAEFVEKAKAVGYDLAELRKENLLGPFRADPRVKAILG